jgi:DNA-binding CsgD family transcriptional regulator
MLGAIRDYQHDPWTARRFYEEAIALCRTTDNRSWLSLSLASLADNAFDRNEVEEAARHAEEAVAVARAEGFAFGVALGSLELGYVALADGAVLPAAAAFREALETAAAIGFQSGVADALVGTAAMAGAIRRPTAAGRLLGGAERHRDHLGMTRFMLQGHFLRVEEMAQRMLGVDFAADRAVGRAQAPAAILAEATELLLAASRPAVAGEGPPALATGAFTRREREILSLLAEGRTNPEIAAALSISRKTVANHVTGIFVKLEVESRSAAIAKALRLGLA